MVTIKNEAQIEKMRRAGALLHDVLETLRAAVRPGITTMELDRLAEQTIRAGGGIPSFKGYGGFPFSICASVDDQVVHGFSDDTVLKEGQLLSIDCGCILDGWQSDSAFTVPVGRASEEAERLIAVTEGCFWRGAAMARSGRHLSDIGHAVQQYAEANGCSVVRALCGHGIGRKMHEDPSVLNYGAPGRGLRLRPGMTLAIEPMITLGHWDVKQLANGWTYATRDGSLASHYEHTVLVTDGAPEILSWPGKRASEVFS